MMDIEKHKRNLAITSSNEGSPELACRCADSLVAIESLEQRVKELQAEIEGGEEAYGTLVDTIRDLRERLARTENNHSATLNVLARMQSADRSKT